jgi:hypothetical protein
VVTVSGLFKDTVKNANLLTHSGLICIDFDAVENVSQLKAELAKDPYTFAALLSASGNGLAAIVKIDPSKHLESFTGLKAYYFKHYGQLIDESCKNVSRLRFLSHDPAPIINPESKLFKEYQKAPTKQKVVNTVLTGNEFEELLDRICRGSYDLTEGVYQNYLTLGFALASEFGEKGREYFHMVAAQNIKYDPAKADRQFTYCLRDTGQNKVNIATFYYYAKQAGLSGAPGKGSRKVSRSRAERPRGKCIRISGGPDMAPLGAEVQSKRHAWARPRQGHSRGRPATRPRYASGVGPRQQVPRPPAWLPSI